MTTKVNCEIDCNWTVQGRGMEKRQKQWQQKVKVCIGVASTGFLVSVAVGFQFPVAHTRQVVFAGWCLLRRRSVGSGSSSCRRSSFARLSFD